jgi:hypothetical protein
MAKHLIRSGDARTGYIAWCGHKQYSDYNCTRVAETLDLCTKCSSKYYAEQGKTSAYRLGNRLDLSSDSRRYSYKSIYEIIRKQDAAVIGFVVIRLGWGQAWEVHAWSDSNHVSDAIAGAFTPPQMSPDAVKYRPRPDSAGEYGGLFSSKEQALFMVPLLVEQNKLPSYAETLAKATANFEKLRQAHKDDDADRQRAKEARAEKIQRIREEFAGLLGSGTLTNSQTTALTDAAALLGVTL